MTTVIATGCPHSDWEKVLPILQLSGLESAGDTFDKWHDELFRPFSMVDPPQAEYPLQQGPKNGRSVAKLLPEKSTAPLLLAESRSLWLLDFWAAKLPHAQFLLFYTRAESAVAHACVQGIDPHQFLEGWQVANRQLLRFQRCHRRQALLLDAEAAVRHPRELIEACRRFDLPLQSPSEIPPSNPHAATVEQLLAKYLVAERSEVQTLQTELEATAQPLGENIPAEQLQPVELVCSYLQHKVHERNLRHSLSEANEQLQIVENIQKDQTARIEELTSSLADQTDLASSYRAQHDEVHRQLQERDVAMTNLQEDLNNRQDEIGRLQWYLGERDADIVRLKETLTARDGELSMIQHELNCQHECLERQQQEHLADIESLKASLAIKNDENDSLARSLSEQDASMRRMELALEVRDEEMSVLANERQAQMDEKFKFAADLQSHLEEITKEKGKLIRKVADQQEAMDSLLREQGKSTQQISELQAQIQNLMQERNSQKKLSGELQAKIDKLTNALDEKVKLVSERQTQLENAKQDYHKLEVTHKEVTEENELLLLQLHQVQEELEDTFLRNQNLKQAHDRSEAANKQASQENEKLSRELQQVGEELLNKDREIEKQRKRVTKLKQTVSWKITAPVRAMAKPFKRSRKEQKLTNEEVQLLKTSGLFDEEWYLAENEDVAKEGADPVEHFIHHGAAEGRNPSPTFNLRQYLEINPDVADAGINPLIHFVKFGRAEGRSVSC